MEDQVRLYDTRRREVASLDPVTPGLVRVYTCGPTVYDRAHIGNFRTFAFEDVLVKALRRFGYQVDRVMNVTDVGHLLSDADEGEDKLEIGARREGKTAWDIAKKYEELFLEDFDALHLERPAKLVRATDTIQQQIDLIKRLEESGHTYRTHDGVYFDSSTFLTYAELGRLDLAGLQEGARVETNEEKRHPSDFALWKFSPEGAKRDMEWESPWGVGFPGWHIECSAIAIDQLGPELDIHVGGVDHIPVHHTNEIAQSESATGKRFARHWLHTEFLLIDGGKMSKSLGNTYTLPDLETHGVDPLAFKLFTYGATYRSKLNFTWEGMRVAQKNLERMRELAWEGGAGEDAGGLLGRFDAALADDMNLPKAIAVLWEVLKSDLTLEKKQDVVAAMDAVLSLELLQKPTGVEQDIPEEVKKLAGEREALRQAKDWAGSDRLREEIERLGYQVKDTAEGPKINKK